MLFRSENDADKSRVVAALITSAEKDAFWRIRRAALSVIANIYSPDPPPGAERPAVKLDANVEQAVLRLAKDKEIGVRGDALELLGETQDKKYADLFIAGLTDRSYTIIDQSALAIARVSDPRAFESLVKLTNTPSWKGRIHAAGLEGLAELGDKRAFDIGFKAATDKSLSSNLRSTALGIVAASGKGDPRAFPLIFGQFKTAVESTNVGDIINGVEALIKIADPRGQEAFDILKLKFKGQTDALNAIEEYEKQFKAAIKP